MNSKNKLIIHSINQSNIHDYGTFDCHMMRKYMNKHRDDHESYVI